MNCECKARGKGVMAFLLLGGLLVISAKGIVLAKSDEIPRPSDGAVLFYMDSACFPSLSNKENTYVELYYGIPLNQLSFEERADTLFAYFILNTSIKDSTGREVKAINIARRYYALTLEEMQSESPILENRGLELPPATYSYRTEVLDGNSNRKGYLEGELQIPNYNTPGLSVSQIQFAYRIFNRSAEKKSPFYKNGMKIIPNVNRIYGYQYPMLFFYFEINNTPSSADKDSTKIIIDYQVYDQQDSLVKSFRGQQRSLARNALAEMGGFSVVTLPTGRYRLKVNVKDLSTGKQASTERDFQFIGVERPVVGTTLLASDNRELTEEEAEDYYAQITYIATKEEKKIYRALSLDRKLAFLREFWKKRDPTPETERNEAMIEHYRRWYFVKRRYSIGKLLGWKTDRGRIYIQYGPPDEIERHSGGMETKPYEIWSYYQNNMQFIFADLQGVDRYELIHSVTQDHRELENPLWKRRIKVVKKGEDIFKMRP